MDTLTNQLLERIAIALEAIVLHGFNVDLHAPPLTEEEILAAEKEARVDEVDEELLAVVEMMEDSAPGKVPIEVYRRLGIEPPENRHDPGELTDEILSAPQPRPEDEELEDEGPEQPPPSTARPKFDLED